MNWEEVQPALFKVLPKDAQGDLDAEVLYASVGRALSFWEALQFSLSFLFGACSGSTLQYPVMRAFGLSTLVIAKLDMIQCAAEISLARHKDLLSQVTDLLSSVKGYNDRRNDIAHGVVQIFAISSHYLVPTAGMSKKYPVYAGGAVMPQPKYCWNSAQIDRYTKAFQQLNQDCGVLALEVRSIVEKDFVARSAESTYRPPS